MAEKKRKSAEDKGQRPKRTKTAGAPEGTVQVELIENADQQGPYLAATPGLAVPARIAFTPYTRRQTAPHGQTTELLLHSADHSRLDYLAHEEKDGSAESQLKDYVGVFDPATNKLQIVPVKRVVVRTTLRSETDEMRDEKARAEAQQGNMYAKRAALAAEFGSKKSRKRIEDRTLNAIRNDNADSASSARNDAVAENVLQNMAHSSISMPTKDELEAAVDSSKPRPRANLAAEYPGDVYTTDTLIGGELMTMLEVKDWVEASAAGKGVAVSSKFVAKRIVKLAKNKQIQKLKVLRFILLCINFNAALEGPTGLRAKKIPPHGKLEAAMGHDTPAGCVTAIRRKFVSEGGDMPRWHIDNLMTHVAAAALIVDDNEVDVHDLRDDLKLDNKDIKQYFSELGCKVAAPNSTEASRLKLSKTEVPHHNIAKLKLPLSFPKVNNIRLKKKT